MKPSTLLYKSDYFKPLEECSKESTADDASEYDTMIAISRMPEVFTYAELCVELNQVLLDRQLSDLIDKGLVQAVWDEKQEAVIFFALATKKKSRKRVAKSDS